MTKPRFREVKNLPEVTQLIIEMRAEHQPIPEPLQRADLTFAQANYVPFITSLDILSLRDAVDLAIPIL